MHVRIAIRSTMMRSMSVTTLAISLELPVAPLSRCTPCSPPIARNCSQDEVIEEPYTIVMFWLVLRQLGHDLPKNVVVLEALCPPDKYRRQ